MGKVIGILFYFLLLFSIPRLGVLCVNFHISSACRNISDFKKKKKTGY